MIFETILLKILVGSGLLLPNSQKVFPSWRLSVEKCLREAEASAHRGVPGESS